MSATTRLRRGVVLLLLTLAGCGGDAPPPPAPPTPEPGPARPADPGPVIAVDPLAHVATAPYRVGVATVGLDDEATDALVAAIARRWSGLLTPRALRLDERLVRGLLADAPPPAPSTAQLREAAGVDRVLLVGRAEDGATCVREWLPMLGRRSTIWRGRSSPADVRPALEGVESLFSWEVRVISAGKGKATARLRGGGLLMGRTVPVRVGDLGPIDYHEPGAADRYRGVRGGLARVTEVAASPLGVTVALDLLSWYVPKPGDRWRRLQLPGGTRPLRILSNEGKPQAGFVVYAHPTRYARSHDDFAGTSDSEGRVQLRAEAGQCRFVMVVSTVDDVEFIFFQGVLPIATGLPEWEVRVPSFGALASEASEVRKRRLSSEQMAGLRRQIQSLIASAALLLRNNRYAQAIHKTEQALKLLAGVQNNDATRLRETVARLKTKYEENRRREQQLSKRTEVLAELAQADALIVAGQWKQGEALLASAAKKWPANLFPERAKQIQAKLTAARRLLKDAATPLGASRQRLLTRVDQLTRDLVEADALAELEADVQRLMEDGISDPAVPYSDHELLAGLKLRLDRVAQRTVAEIQQLKKAYDASMDTTERGKLYERSERLAGIRAVVERLLRRMTRTPSDGGGR